MIDLDTLAGQTPGFTGADLSNLVNEAALLSARNGKREITQVELEEGIMRVIAGPEKKTRVMSEKERLITAYHEMGHAIVGHFLEHSDPVHKISIISRGQALGYTISMPTEDRFLTTRAELTDTMAMTLGGRAAEEIVFGEITTGASNDLEKVTATAKQMVMRFGMSEKLGPRVFGHDHGQPFLGREFSSEPDYSDEIAREIDDEIRRIVEAAHQRAKDILTEHREHLGTITEILVKRETIEAEQFEALLDGAARRTSSAPRSPRTSTRLDAAPPTARAARPRARCRARASRRRGSIPRARPRRPGAAEARAATPDSAPELALDARSRGLIALMGVLNVTPDSFSDGGEWFSFDDAASRTGASWRRRARRSWTSAASRRGRAPRRCREEEELRRVVPVIEALAGAAQLSIDTSKVAVARAALDAGATLRQRRHRVPRRAGDGGARRRARLRVLPDAHARRAAHDAGRPALRRRRRRHQGVPVRARWRSPWRRGSPRSGSRSTPGSGSARRSSTTSSCCGAWTRSRRSGFEVVIGTSRKSFLAARPAATIRTTAWPRRSRRPCSRSSAGRPSSASTTSPRPRTR